MSEDLDKPTVLRQQMYERLSPSIKEKTEQIAIKQMQVEVMAKKLEDDTAALMVRQNEMQVAIEDLEKLKSDLRVECRSYLDKL